MLGVPSASWLKLGEAEGNAVLFRLAPRSTSLQLALHRRLGVQVHAHEVHAKALVALRHQPPAPGDPPDAAVEGSRQLDLRLVRPPLREESVHLPLPHLVLDQGEVHPDLRVKALLTREAELLAVHASGLKVADLRIVPMLRLRPREDRVREVERHARRVLQARLCALFAVLDRPRLSPNLDRDGLHIVMPTIEIRRILPNCVGDRDELRRHLDVGSLRHGRITTRDHHRQRRLHTDTACQRAVVARCEHL
mmetsp:Transcript_98977/g.285637  ORF Transcript_98977/g.285637 Transcript_98977/m.285637 type:complete len:251 (-) Transcript_98977:69-821(-)